MSDAADEALDKWDAFPDRIRALERVKGCFDAFRLAADGCDVLFGNYPAGADIAPHTHDTDNWGLITKGEMCISCEGRASVFRVGEWYHIPAGGEHSARCAVNTETIEFWFAHTDA